MFQLSSEGEWACLMGWGVKDQGSQLWSPSGSFHTTFQWIPHLMDEQTGV